MRRCLDKIKLTVFLLSSYIPPTSISVWSGGGKGTDMVGQVQPIESIREGEDSGVSAFPELKLGWTPVELDIRHTVECVDRTKTGLLMCYPRKVYSSPAAIRYIVHPSLLEIDRVKKTVAIARITVYHDVKLTKYSHYADVLNIELLPPKRPETKPKYHLIIAAYRGKSTGIGSYRKVIILRGEEHVIWRVANSSSSGNHWIDYIVALLPPKADVLLQENYRSSRGNVDEYLISLKTGKGVGRYEILETAPVHPYVRKLRIRDNLTREEFTAIELEYHIARKTSAETDHEWEPKDALVPLYDTRAFEKTHWTEGHKVMKPVRIKTVRITNCGNSYEWVSEVEP